MRFSVPAILLLILLEICPSGLARQQTAKGSIEGSVLRATGEAVSGAQVIVSVVNPNAAVSAAAGPAAGGTLNSSGPTVAFTSSIAPPDFAAGVVSSAVTTRVAEPLPPSVPTAPRPAGPYVTTGNDGGFSFKDLNPGTYRITVIANGYVRQEYGQRVINGIGTPVYLTAGQSLKDLSIRLTPTATVSGRIIDESGQPATGVPIQLIRVVYNPQGKTYSVAGTANANDRGEYRLFGVVPGRYYLNAGNAPGPRNRPAAAGGNTGQPAGVSYAVTYFPGVPDISQAGLIELTPGAELPMNMLLQRQQSYRIRGRLVDSRTGQAPPAATVSLTYRTLNGGGSSSSPRNYDPATGTFELQNVTPGLWGVEAQIQEELPIAAGQLVLNNPDVRRAATATRPTGQVAINVTNSDIEGLVVTLTTGAPISGRVSVEGQPISALTNIDRIRVQIRPSINGAPNSNNTGTSPVALATNPDGTFRIEAVRGGEYLVAVNGLPPGFYVKAIRYEDSDILNDKPFTFSGAGSGTMEVILRSGPGQLSGSVANERLQPVPGVQAILIPDSGQRRGEPYRVALTDENGRFSITGITPGDYKLFSWEAIEQGAFYDPEFLRKYEQQGRAVHVAESSSGTVDVKLIPAPAQ